MQPINLITPDTGEKYLIELENATLTNMKGLLAKNPDLTLTINRFDLEQVMMGRKTLEVQIADGAARIDGDASVLQRLAATMVEFDPKFEVMPGSKQLAQREQVDPFEAVPRPSITE
ncbi:MAG: hypothetical protein K2X71_19625 [Methylobacterium sp.]|uniref:alkyl sulfatase C-terminal domain-containing protein n=1 Tax=Methylobacterium sp. TaxID=409 RepID=UPI00258B7A11|nr:alkyl sulfatase C-terminal domain-containing protein [Methylobacterium sp.]MBY0298211.1 hypothetical protein [Methylobacterium sp.]